MFGGAPVLVFGDFRQSLPTVPYYSETTANTRANNSYQNFQIL